MRIFRILIPLLNPLMISLCKIGSYWSCRGWQLSMFQEICCLRWREDNLWSLASPNGEGVALLVVGTIAPALPVFPLVVLLFAVNFCGQIQVLGKKGIRLAQEHFIFNCPLLLHFTMIGPIVPSGGPWWMCPVGAFPRIPLIVLVWGCVVGGVVTMGGACGISGVYGFHLVVTGRIHWYRNISSRWHPCHGGRFQNESDGPGHIAELLHKCGSQWKQIAATMVVSWCWFPISRVLCVMHLPILIVIGWGMVWILKSLEKVC